MMMMMMMIMIPNHLHECQYKDIICIYTNSNHQDKGSWPLNKHIAPKQIPQSVPKEKSWCFHDFTFFHIFWDVLKQASLQVPSITKQNHCMTSLLEATSWLGFPSGEWPSHRSA